MLQNKSTKGSKFRNLFKNENEVSGENVDIKWILDMLDDEKKSPKRPMQRNQPNTKDISSKSHLKSIFNNSKFTTSKNVFGNKQVNMTSSRKLGKQYELKQPVGRKINFANENKKDE